MSTQYTSLLGLALPVTGELSGTWGDTVNNAITSLLDSAVAGTTTVSTDGDVTLTTTTGAANQARQAIILCSGARTAQRTITAPAQSKIYTIINATTGGFAVKLVGAGPTVGITVVAGESAQVAWNGSDFIKISNTGGSASFTNVTVSGTTTLSGLTASTALALDASKNVVSVTNTGTGNNVLSASPTLTGTVAGASLQLSSLTSGRVTYAGASGLLQDSANLTFDGTTLTANALSVTNGVTLSGGTANGVAYLNGSKVLTTGSALTFDGANLLNTAGNIRAGGNVNSGYLSAWGGGSGATIDIIPNTISGANGVVYNTSFISGGAGPHIFQIGGSEQMRLTSTGLGIGTSSPAAQLVVSNAGAQGLEFAGSNGSIQVYNRSTSAYGTMNLYANTIYFRTGASPALNATLDSSGNLGLGVTPSAWFFASKGLQIPSGALTSYGSNVQNLSMNAYLNSSGAWTYITTNPAALYQQSNNSHAWFTAPSGTAGAAISFTQAMTLTAGGNLLVGTTTDGGQRARIARSGAGVILNLGDNTAQNFDISSNAASGSSGVITLDTSNGAAQAFSIGGTERARIDSSGNLLVGMTSGAGKLNVGAGGELRVYRTDNATYGSIKYVTGSGGLQLNDQNSDGITFVRGGSTESARIDSSGNLLVGKTATGISTVGVAAKDYVEAVRDGNPAGYFNRLTSDGDVIQIYSRSVKVGSISVTSTATAYNTSSDYRLKNITGPVRNSGTYIDSLKPVEGTWKADGSTFVGLIAHEAQEVSRTSVATGEKDGKDMQAMDYGNAEFIANIIAELQSLRARVAQLEAKGA